MSSALAPFHSRSGHLVGTPLGHTVDEFGTGTDAELAVYPGEVGLDRRLRGVQLRGYLPVLATRRHECGHAHLGGGERVITTRSRVSPQRLVLGLSQPERGTEPGEDVDRLGEGLRCPAALAKAAQRIAGNEQRSGTVERRADRCERLG